MSINLENRTAREVSVWSWLAKILPLTILAIIAVFYTFGWDTQTTQLINLTIIVFFIFCCIWWFWALKKIAMFVMTMRSTKTRFKELVVEIRKLRKDINFSRTKK